MQGSSRLSKIFLIPKTTTQNTRKITYGFIWSDYLLVKIAKANDRLNVVLKVLQGAAKMTKTGLGVWSRRDVIGGQPQAP